MEKPDPYAALRFWEFRNFTIARLCITIASQMQAVIVGWQIYEITKDPFSLGLIGLAEAIPSISVLLFAGHITDISDRKKIVLYSVLLMSFCSLMLLLITSDLIHSLSTNKLILIYSVIFLSGIGRGFSAPSFFAFVSQLVPKEILPNAITWNTTTWQTGAVTGPAIGGLLYGFIGATNTFITIVIFWIISVFMILPIKNKPVPVIIGIQSLKEKLTAGLKFVFERKIVLGAISLDLFAVLFGGAVALLPIFAGEILFAGPEGLGILRAAPSIGAVIMAVTMTRRPFTKNAGKNLIISVFGFGLCIILFGISKNFYLSLIILALSGAFDSVSVVIRATIIQLMTPDNMKGRVSAVNSIFIGSSNEIGAFESGVAAKLLGTVPSVIFGGVMTILIVTVVTFAFPKLRRLKL
ncbi:MAG: MFS transporter [Ignavibacteria bacterium]|nr:MFS transporter [Ignavibacteria bacterium]MBK7253978.1 MFS transporter [Ignavibacteria bacterium]MBK9403944.1 MFS transporter [Ignavibacteria bacterium]